MAKRNVEQTFSGRQIFARKFFGQTFFPMNCFWARTFWMIIFLAQNFSAEIFSAEKFVAEHFFAEKCFRRKQFCQPKKRFGVIYNLLSVSSNTRLKVKFYCEDDTNPSLPTATTIWASANWYEREAYDLLGIIFINHPDLRRLLTDYGFIGHPLRKDFPLIGNVEVNYDLEKQRVVYQPVTIKPRVLIPKVIREVLEKEYKNA